MKANVPIGIFLPAVFATLVSFSPFAFAENVRARLKGFEEVPAVSSEAKGLFRADIDRRAGTIEYVLSYEGLESDALQSHIHFGQRSVNGGISVFLCTNLGNAQVQACPLTSGTVSGFIQAGDVIGPDGQGIAAGEIDELIAAIRAGVAYVNVHSTDRPGGEIRGQLR